jgi:hypothetical protein
MNNLLIVFAEQDILLEKPIPNFKTFQKIGFAFTLEGIDQGTLKAKLKKTYGYRFIGLYSI